MIPAQAILWFWYVAGTIMGVGLPLIVLILLIVIIVKGFRLEQTKEARRRGIH